MATISVRTKLLTFECRRL